MMHRLLLSLALFLPASVGWCQAVVGTSGNNPVPTSGNSNLEPLLRQVIQAAETATRAAKQAEQAANDAKEAANRAVSAADRVAPNSRRASLVELSTALAQPNNASASDDSEEQPAATQPAATQPADEPFVNPLGGAGDTSNAFQSSAVSFTAGPLTQNVVDYDETNIGDFGRDQRPYETALEIRDLFEKAITRAQELAESTAPAKEIDTSEQKQLVDFIRDGLSQIYGNHRGSEKDWSEFFKSLSEKLEKSVLNGEKVQLALWTNALKQLMQGFDKVLKKRSDDANITEADVKRNLEISGRQGSTAAVSGGFGYQVSGTSIAALWHARAMSRIKRRHARQSYRIERITVR